MCSRKFRGQRCGECESIFANAVHPYRRGTEEAMSGRHYYLNVSTYLVCEVIFFHVLHLAAQCLR
jgi:hypothetical protein